MKSSNLKVGLRVAIAALTIIIAPAALADTADEIRALIADSAAYTKANLKDMDGGISADGALSFWSSGGLMHKISPDAEPASYESFSLTPKHVKVITLVEGEAAVAMYYSEGGYVDADGGSVPHYMTRITEVYVNEGGEWKLRASHYSPIAAGSGTHQTAVN